MSKVCFHFPKGRCNRGNSCKFEHVNDKMTGAADLAGGGRGGGANLSDALLSDNTLPLTLQALCSESIRKNWDSMKHLVEMPESFIYNILWDFWYLKFDFGTNQNKEKNDIFIQTLREFVDGKEIKTNKFALVNENELVLQGLSKWNRKKVRVLCDQIGLHHQSTGENFHVYRPSNWKWEFTDKNPFLENTKVSKQKKTKKSKPVARDEERMRRKYCDGCGANGLDKRLLCSIYFSELYCESCLDELSDGEGGLLNDHKFEDIY